MLLYLAQIVRPLEPRFLIVRNSRYVKDTFIGKKRYVEGKLNRNACHRNIK